MRRRLVVRSVSKRTEGGLTRGESCMTKERVLSLLASRREDIIARFRVKQIAEGSLRVGIDVGRINGGRESLS